MDFFWKLAHKMYQYKETEKLARLCELLSFIISSHAVSAQIKLGKGSKFYHHGLGCVSIQTVEIGNNTVIFQNVTLGAKWNGVCGVGGGKITIGDNVMIGAGAVLLGDLKIGNNVSIGANAVVLQDIPDNCVVAGVPAKYIEKRKL